MNVRFDTVLCCGSLLHILPLTVQDNLAYRNNMHAYAANSRPPRLCEGLLAVRSFTDKARLFNHTCQDANWAKV